MPRASSPLAMFPCLGFEHAQSHLEALDVYRLSYTNIALRNWLHSKEAASLWPEDARGAPERPSWIGALVYGELLYGRACTVRPCPLLCNDASRLDPQQLCNKAAENFTDWKMGLRLCPRCFGQKCVEAAIRAFLEARPTSWPQGTFRKRPESVVIMLCRKCASPRTRYGLLKSLLINLRTAPGARKGANNDLYVYTPEVKRARVDTSRRCSPSESPHSFSPSSDRSRGRSTPSSSYHSTDRTTNSSLTRSIGCSCSSPLA